MPMAIPLLYRQEPPSFASMRSFILIFFLFFFSSFFSQELTQTIRGTVLDKQTQSPLPGAIVSIPGTEPLKAASTDENGKFRIENVAIGRWQLKISSLSYKEKVQAVILTSGKETVLNI